MFLKVRLLILTLSASLLMLGGVVYFGFESKKIAEQHLAEVSLNGHEALWRKLLSESQERLEAALARPEFEDAIIQHDYGALSALSDPAVATWQVISPKGEMLYASPGDAPPLVTVDALIKNGLVVSRSVHKEDGTLAAIIALGANVHPLLAEFKSLSGNEAFLVDHLGRISAGTAPSQWSHIAEETYFSFKRRWQVVRDGSHAYSLTVLPITAREIRGMVAVKDVSQVYQNYQDLMRQAFWAFGVTLFLILAFAALYLRNTFVPLQQSTTVLKALLKGDVTRTVAIPKHHDEIGKLAEAVRALRDQAELQLSQERQRFRQEMFIRMEMHHLAQMLTDEARQAILSDLAAIENNSVIDIAGEKEIILDEKDGLAKAFSTMTSYIREHSAHLDRIISEQVQDVQNLREALRRHQAEKQAAESTPYTTEDEPILAHLPPADETRQDFTITNTIAEVEHLAAIVAAYVVNHKLPEALALNLTMALDELLRRIILNGFPNGETEDILIGMRLEDGYLITEIVDDGIALDPFMPGLLSQGSSGGILVQSLTSKTNYERLGGRNVTTLWQRV